MKINKLTRKKQQKLTFLQEQTFLKVLSNKYKVKNLQKIILNFKLPPQISLSKNNFHLYSIQFELFKARRPLYF